MALGLLVAGATLIAANQDSVGELLSGLLSATVIPGLPVVAFVAAVLVLAVAAFTRPDPRAGFLTWATSSFGVAYISLLLPFVAVVGHLGPADGSAATQVGGLALKAGTAWLITLLLLVWGYDTGAYLTGRWIGRRRLIDHVSPSKTIEGLAGGLVAATIAAGIGTWLVGMAPWHAAGDRAAGRPRGAGGRPGRVAAQARRQPQGLRLPVSRARRHARSHRLIPVRRPRAGRLRAAGRGRRHVIGVAVLGSTGSIGRQTLEVIQAHPDRFRVTGLAAGGQHPGSRSSWRHGPTRAHGLRLDARPTWTAGAGPMAAWRSWPPPTAPTWWWSPPPA